MSDGAIVRFGRFSIQRQMARKKPYQMARQRLDRRFQAL